MTTLDIESAMPQDLKNAKPLTISLKDFLKLCLDKHSMNLSKKEASGYKYFEQPEKTRFLLPKYKLINVHNDYVLSKI